MHMMLKVKKGASWWFQPNWNILVKIGSFPQIGMNIENIWNHHPDELFVSIFIQSRITGRCTAKNAFLRVHFARQFNLFHATLYDSHLRFTTPNKRLSMLQVLHH